MKEMPEKLYRHISEKAYVIALGLIYYFSEDKVRGPNFDWTEFLDETLYTITLSQIMASLSGNHYKLYKESVEQEVLLKVTQISYRYKDIFKNLGIIE